MSPRGDGRGEEPGPAADGSPGAAGGPPAASLRWLVLVYRVPSEPSRLRASLWRRLKTLGAVYLQSAVAALPESAEAERALRRLRSQIVEEMGGTAYLLSCQSLTGGSEMAELFKLARDDEYEEVVDRCRDFLAEIDQESAAGHFTFGELEENEEDLAKLRRWLDKVRARDVLGSDGAGEAEAALRRCEASLEAYATRVYEIDSEKMGR